MVATKPVTVDEFAAMPLEGAWELVDGEMIELSPTADKSGWVSGRVFSRIERFVDAHRLGWAFPQKRVSSYSMTAPPYGPPTRR
jgi:hypothetical protein